VMGGRGGFAETKAPCVLEFGVNICVCVRFILCGWRMYGTTSNWALPKFILREFWAISNLRAWGGVRDVAKGSVNLN
jgi:hypothetical protein